ncbi:Bis(5'-nucleosyl)-tetraphosphatase [Winogradskyella psychrotolerans RS-3]|uniref:Bis(5'-nucleosyl)-tetraphosphatase n=1 Tax=Winogradskyella psychrotolerans RS-3 TaxID=641526 RepID=S7WTQ2_9FLAO|nr:NUDIX domain-containing protein [Winogradskyella psychrotolerans]EPR70109.1 Bis(5'-nucleosyl)-tetraphosphatase [Winogradskyella psychrotolerans RS-3]
MYTIYVGDKPIILTTEVTKETDFKSFLLKSVNIGKVIKTLNNTDLKSVHLIHKNEDKLLKKFLKLLPNVVAGGGKAYNSKNEILFIYRNDKWDLPKGKAERKESIEETAIREVEEETGVEGLKITKPLPTTYHIFKRNGKHKIKVTYWFEMSTDFEGELFPQENEGITKVEWLDDKASQKALENSYANIRILV